MTSDILTCCLVRIFAGSSQLSVFCVQAMRLSDACFEGVSLDGRAFLPGLQAHGGVWDACTVGATLGSAGQLPASAVSAGPGKSESRVKLGVCEPKFRPRNLH